jgi:hypothetical protein
VSMKKSLLALVLGPSIALAVQSTMYSMVTPACSAQMRLNIHLTAAVALAIVVVLAVLAYGESSLRRREPASPDDDRAHAPVPHGFLGDLGAAVAGLAALVILAMWFSVWVLSPCDIF